jgi:hypothetical protein
MWIILDLVCGLAGASFSEPAAACLLLPLAEGVHVHHAGNLDSFAWVCFPFFPNLRALYRFLPYLLSFLPSSMNLDGIDERSCLYYDIV